MPLYFKERHDMSSGRWVLGIDSCLFLVWWRYAPK